jgi:hypothetical protein
VEVSHVRNRLRSSIESARSRAQERRRLNTEAERSFGTFLELAGVLARQVANALKVEANLGFTVSTPEGGVRLASDRSRDDFIEITLDTSGSRPEVVGRVRLTRGSRVVEEERPIIAGATPDALTEDDVLEYLITALQPWLERT